MRVVVADDYEKLADRLAGTPKIMRETAKIAGWKRDSYSPDSSARERGRKRWSRLQLPYLARNRQFAHRAARHMRLSKQRVEKTLQRSPVAFEALHCLAVEPNRHWRLAIGLRRTARASYDARDRR
jgi:hypothetical protein